MSELSDAELQRAIQTNAGRLAEWSLSLAVGTFESDPKVYVNVCTNLAHIATRLQQLAELRLKMAERL